jgi:uncharacterized protein (DUF58 family)
MFNRTADVDSAGRISITPRQIYIVPTRFGLVFACMVLAMLVGANNYGINLAFALTFFLTGLGLSAMLQTWRNLVHTRISPGNVEPVFCGDVAIFPVHLQNNRPSSRSGLQLRIHNHSSACDVPANSAKGLTCQVPSSKRGYLEAGRWTLFSYFPLGMFYSWAYFHTGQRCLVYPSPADSSVPLDQLFRSRFFDLLLVDETADFRGHRKYQPGDNIKRIDWKALARGRGKLTKDFRKPQQNDIWLRWSDVLADDVEEILSILCRAVLELEQANVEYGLEIPGTVIDPDCGPQQTNQCLASLALFRQ